MHEDMWLLAIMVAAIACWLLYRYLAPASWKEWASAGVLQAFVIAFYAEMYGFPMTLYFLARYADLDLSDAAGSNLWAQLFGSPYAHLVAMGLGYAIVFSGAALVADGWRRVHRARNEDRLVTDGPYARMRHPQYTGLFLILFGEGIVHWPTLLSVAAFPIVVIAYTLLARREEQDMIRTYGDAYQAYQQDVPMFWPRRGWAGAELQQ